MTLGERQGSPKRKARAVRPMLNQKLEVVKTAVTKRGRAMRLPPMQTQAFIMGRPLPNLSEIRPPDSEDVKPQTILISEYARANSAFLVE